MKMKKLIKEEILEEIKGYSPHTEKLTLSTLMAINQGIHILNVGASGIGKTRSTAELLNLLKIPHTTVSGHISPKAFFQILQDDGIIVVDEGADLLSDATVINLLLNALWNGNVEWVNNRERLHHNFKGIIIFNTNITPNNALMLALKNRVFTNEISLKSSQIKDKILSSKDYKPNTRIWAEIKETIERKSELSKPILGKIYQIIDGSEPKSVRDLWKLERIASFSLTLFNDLSLIEYFTPIDEVWKIINSNIKRSEKVKKIAELKCITDEAARKILRKHGL